MTLSEAQASRRPTGCVGVSSTDSGLPPITRLPSPHAVLTTPVDRFGTCRLEYGALPRRVVPKPLWPSRNERPVGIHIFPFEACSSFTRLTPAEDQCPALSRDKVSRWSSLLVRPADLLAHLKWTLSRGSHPGSYPPKRPVSYPSHIDNSWSGTLTHWQSAPLGRAFVLHILFLAAHFWGQKGGLVGWEILSCQGPVGRVSEHLAVREIGPETSFSSALSMEAVKWFWGGATVVKCR
jgi:hypothetical protein